MAEDCLSWMQADRMTRLQDARAGRPVRSDAAFALRSRANEREIRHVLGGAGPRPDDMPEFLRDLYHATATLEIDAAKEQTRNGGSHFEVPEMDDCSLYASATPRRYFTDSLTGAQLPVHGTHLSDIVIPLLANGTFGNRMHQVLANQSIDGRDAARLSGRDAAVVADLLDHKTREAEEVFTARDGGPNGDDPIYTYVREVDANELCAYRPSWYEAHQRRVRGVTLTPAARTMTGDAAAPSRAR